MIKKRVKYHKQRSRITVVGSILDTICQRKGWNWTDLARESGIDKTTVSRIMQGQTERPQPETIGKICDALGLQPEECDDIFTAYGLSTEDMQERAIARLQRHIMLKK